MTVNHSERGHAMLSPSASSRYLGNYPLYLGCTCAPEFESRMPNTTSIAAEEGTLCHEICELTVRSWLNNESYKDEIENLRTSDLYNVEMEDCAQQYTTYIQKHSNNSKGVLLEQKVDISHYLDNCFGIADCIIYSDRYIHIIDYKHGKGVKVDAAYNTQLMLYALGAWYNYPDKDDIEEIKLTIFQPRINNVSEWMCYIGDLLAFGDLVKAKNDEIKNFPSFRPSESACKFCRARGECRARADRLLSLQGIVDKKPEIIYPKEYQKIINIGKEIKNWLDDLQECALTKILSGQNMPGLKVVPGKAKRTWTDQEKAFRVLRRAGYKSADLYEKKPIPLTTVEKLVSKEDFKKINKYITKTAGKPLLVDESDPRESI